MLLERVRIAALPIMKVEGAEQEGFKPIKKAFSMGAPPIPGRGSPSIEDLRLRDLPANVDLKPLYDLVDLREEVYVQRLREAVAIKGVSAWVDHRPQIVEMIEWAKAWAEKLGCSEARLVDNPRKEQDATLPPLSAGGVSETGNIGIMFLWDRARKNMNFNRLGT